MGSLVSDRSFFVSHGWMRNHLNLKGNELVLYSIIYGFSHSENQTFSGRAEYLAEWMGVERKTVYRLLNGLTEKGLLQKQSQIINGITFNSYRCTPLGQNVSGDGTKCLRGWDKMSQPNIYKKENISKENIYIPGGAENESEPFSPDAKRDARQEIIAYLNEKAQTSFRANSKETARHINARLKEGYTIEDCKAVIDCKVKQWGKNPEMSRYLRPETLFKASKFEGYVQEAKKGGTGEVVETHDEYCGDFI